MAASIQAEGGCSGGAWASEASAAGFATERIGAAGVSGAGSLAPRRSGATGQW